MTVRTIGQNDDVDDELCRETCAAAFRALSAGKANFDTVMSVGESIIASAIVQAYSMEGKPFPIEAFLRNFGTSLRAAIAVMEKPG